MSDLEAIRAALDPDDEDGHALIDFDRYPEATLNGVPLTRQQRIDGAAMRPAWQQVMREMEAFHREHEPTTLGVALGGQVEEGGA